YRARFGKSRSKSWGNGLGARRFGLVSLERLRDTISVASMGRGSDEDLAPFDDFAWFDGNLGGRPGFRSGALLRSALRWQLPFDGRRLRPARFEPLSEHAAWRQPGGELLSRRGPGIRTAGPRCAIRLRLV